MNQIKTVSQNQPEVETVDQEKAAIGLIDGTIVVAYLSESKVLSCTLDEKPVQIVLHKSSVYVLTKPFPLETDSKEENEEVLAINILAAKKTGITLWQLEIRENGLSIINKREKTGGFAIHNDRLFACDPFKEGFYILDSTLKEIERVGISIKPTNRKPWFSSIFIIDSILYLMQEDDLIRWFSICENITEGGILKPDDSHVSYFIGINNAPKKLIKAGNYVVGTTESTPHYLINFKEDNPYIANNPDTYINLKYKNLYTFPKNMQASTDRYAIANNKHVISIADTNLNEIQYAFWLSEADETLNITRLTAFENYVICFAWTYKRKFPVLIFDMTDLKNPQIKTVINFGGDIHSVTIEED